MALQGCGVCHLECVLPEMRGEILRILWCDAARDPFALGAWSALRETSHFFYNAMDVFRLEVRNSQLPWRTPQALLRALAAADFTCLPGFPRAAGLRALFAIKNMLIAPAMCTLGGDEYGVALHFLAALRGIAWHDVSLFARGLGAVLVSTSEQDHDCATLLGAAIRNVCRGRIDAVAASLRLDNSVQVWLMSSPHSTRIRRYFIWALVARTPTNLRDLLATWAQMGLPEHRTAFALDILCHLLFAQLCPAQWHDLLAVLACDEGGVYVSLLSTGVYNSGFMSCLYPIHRQALFAYRGIPGALKRLGRICIRLYRETPSEMGTLSKDIVLTSRDAVLRWQFRFRDKCVAARFPIFDICNCYIHDFHQRADVERFLGPIWAHVQKFTMLYSCARTLYAHVAELFGTVDEWRAIDTSFQRFIVPLVTGPFRLKHKFHVISRDQATFLAGQLETRRASLLLTSPLGRLDAFHDPRGLLRNALLAASNRLATSLSVAPIREDAEQTGHKRKRDADDAEEDADTARFKRLRGDDSIASHLS